MSLQHHHPEDETLARFAAGTLGGGPRLVIAAHLETCPACRTRVGLFEAVGGELLNALAPVEMAADALARTFARIERDSARPHTAPRRSKMPDLPDGVRLPAALNDCDITPWRWGAPGFRWSRVRVPGDSNANVILLRVAAGKKMPRHGHTGTELNLVLSGSFSDENGHYQPGDLCEADDEIEHQPIVDRNSECICLAAVEGQIRLQGFFGKMMQPLIGV